MEGSAKALSWAGYKLRCSLLTKSETAASVCVSFRGSLLKSKTCFLSRSFGAVSEFWEVDRILKIY